MNLPNKITILRVLLIPAMIVLYYIDPDKTTFTTPNIIILALFIIASFTDFLDGYLARKNDLVTTFGKFLDPLADKLLVMFALLLLMQVGYIPLWSVFIILAREFIVTGIRLVAMGAGNVIAASNLGKYKTFATMVALIVLLVYPAMDSMLYYIGISIFYVGVILTIISGLDYFIKNKHSVLQSK